MALIEDSIGRTDEDSGYGRVFGNNSLGKLISRVHVCAIRNGNELEEVLWNRTPYKANLNAILGAAPSATQLQSIQVVSAKTIRQSMPGAPLTDLLVLDRILGELAVVELKDGDTFDTKKADGELASAQRFTDWIRPQIAYPVHYYFCAFNQPNKDSIVKGIKNRFKLSEVMTGAELCRRIGVDYADVRIYRQNHQAANQVYFVKQLYAIPGIREIIMEQLTSE